MPIGHNSLHPLNPFIGISFHDAFLVEPLTPAKNLPYLTIGFIGAPGLGSFQSHRGVWGDFRQRFIARESDAGPGVIHIPLWGFTPFDALLAVTIPLGESTVLLGASSVRMPFAHVLQVLAEKTGVVEGLEYKQQELEEDGKDKQAWVVDKINPRADTERDPGVCLIPKIWASFNLSCHDYLPAPLDYVFAPATVEKGVKLVDYMGALFDLSINVAMGGLGHFGGKLIQGEEISFLGKRLKKARVGDGLAKRLVKKTRLGRWASDGLDNALARLRKNLLNPMEESVVRWRKKKRAEWTDYLSKASSEKRIADAGEDALKKGRKEVDLEAKEKALKEVGRPPRVDEEPSLPDWMKRYKAAERRHRAAGEQRIRLKAEKRQRRRERIKKLAFDFRTKSVREDFRAKHRAGEMVEAQRKADELASKADEVASKKAREGLPELQRPIEPGGEEHMARMRRHKEIYNEARQAQLDAARKKLDAAANKPYVPAALKKIATMPPKLLLRDGLWQGVYSPVKAREDQFWYKPWR